MTKPTLHIAVGVLINAQGHVLIAQRRAGTDGAGKWEFPGGKREPGESIQAALTRELDEELGIQVQQLRPMLRFHHDYTARRVLLDIWRVNVWQGEAHGREGQKVTWCAPQQLRDYDLLSANKPIVDAIRLPSSYVISPEPSGQSGNAAAFLRQAHAIVEQGARLLRLRAWNMSDAAYEALAKELLEIIRPYTASLMLDRSAEMVERLGAAGLHLPAHRLDALERRPVDDALWFAASCHDRAELLQAQALKADFVVLSPVKPTSSHPDLSPLGWNGFAEARDDIPLPIYALGGLTPGDIQNAWENGAQGCAGITHFW